MTLSPRLVSPEPRGEDTGWRTWLPALPYRARGWATFVVACVFGPLIAAMCLAAIELASPRHMMSFHLVAIVYGDMVAVSYVLGGPIAVVAGGIAAYRVARDGNIPLLHTATIAFFVPMVPLVMLGGGFGVLFGIFYGVPAAIAAVVVQVLGKFVWKSVAGQPA